MSDFITTYTKIHMDPLRPRKEDICIEDIAHALSLMVRANGHFPEFYSVGQHCVHCCEEAKARGYPERVQLACLLHDASEAYLSDITRPVKRNLTEYGKIEERLLDCIFEKYMGVLTEEEGKLWKYLDNLLLHYEFEHFMGERLFEDSEPLKSHPVFAAEPFRETERKYLEWFGRLYEG